MTPQWEERLRHGVHVLRLDPEAFWSLTVKEWIALTRPVRAGRPLSREALNQLLEAYPDLKREKEDPHG